MVKWVQTVFGESSGSVILINNLDAGNPLHIQANDNSSTTLILFKLSGTENYRIWASAMKLALQARYKYSFVDGSCQKNAYSTSDVLSAQWDRCNDIALIWIMNYVLQDVYMGLVYFENANNVWKELESTYDKVDGSVIFNLLQKIHNVKQGGTSVADYYHRLNSLWRDIYALTKLPKWVYEPLRSALLTMDPLPENNDKQSSASVSSPDFTFEQMQKLLSLINDNTTGSVDANMAGANQQLTVSTVRMFDVIDITSLKIIVDDLNGTLATISHVGNLKLSNNVVLYDVLVVPGYCLSLLSISKLIRDSKMYVSFDEDMCYIQDLKKEKVLGTGSQSGGLYLFDMDKVNNVGKSNMVLCFDVSKLLWRNRLGHPFDQVLSVL
ncbi:ribonuclease H-like domain-containing protein [Tanacetum coccineum]